MWNPFKKKQPPNDSAWGFVADDRNRARVTHPYPNHATIECGSDYTDGYRVTTGWDEDGYWVARISGLSVGDVIGTHDWSQFQAMQDLACSLAATVDAINEPKQQESAL